MDFNEPRAVAEGIRVVTFRVPLGIDHVHCYLLRSRSGGWILVDTALGFDDPEASWRPVLDALDAPVEAIVITHGHPDHVGGAADLAALTGAPVHQGRADYEQAVQIWGAGRREGRFDLYLALHGVPAELLGRPGISARVRLADDPEPLDEGDELDGWRVHVLPGHADGHIVLERHGVLVAGDTILDRISPHVGIFPGSRPDPLADFLSSLAWIEERAPRLALPGHGPLLRDAAGRAREIRGHHADRLDRAAAALGRVPRSAYEIGLDVFGERLARSQTGPVITETLSHLERLLRLGRAERLEGRPIRFTA